MTTSHLVLIRARHRDLIPELPTPLAWHRDPIPELPTPLARHRDHIPEPPLFARHRIPELPPFARHRDLIREVSVVLARHLKARHLMEIVCNHCISLIIVINRLILRLIFRESPIIRFVRSTPATVSHDTGTSQ
jgi:hypothetical protein